MNNLIKKLHEKAKEAAKRFHRAESDLIEILQEIEKHRVFESLGYASLFKYAVEELRLSESNAFNFISVARKAREIPEIKKEIQNGNLSVSKAKKIVSVIKPSNASEWLAKAKTLPRHQLEKAVAKENPKAAVPEQAKYISEKRLELSLGISEEILKKLKRAQDVLSQKRKKAVTLEEVLDQTLDLFLHKEDPLEKAKRSGAKGNAKTKELVFPGTVGSKRKTVPAPLKHQVMRRDDGQCSMKGCDSQRHLEMHHIIPVSRGGEHEASNLELLCASHHRMRHSVDTNRKRKGV